jgi:N-carbamoylputrescine amidase
MPALPLNDARSWSPRPGIAPKTSREGEDFIVTSNGSEGCYGGWEVLYPAPKPGEWVRFSARARWKGLDRGYDCVTVAVTWLNDKNQFIGWEPVFPRGVEDGRVIYEGRVRVSAGAVVMANRLLMAVSGRGEIRFSNVQVTPTDPPRPRKVRLGAAGGPLPPGKRTLKDNTELYLGMCREAAQKKIDMLCLPEIMLSSGMPVNNETLYDLSFPVPGPEIAPFQAFARERKMVLCFSVLERNKELVHNTAVLIDRKGELVGKYRKVHLAAPFETWWGVTPGHEWPVFKLEDAVVGMNICMDSSALESVRVPARKGAEIIFLPIMGDHRASTCFQSLPHDFDVDRWRAIQRVRAMDNQVYMVISRNSGYGTGIFSPRGEVLAISGGARVVHADVDLEDLPRVGQDATFRGVCWYERREPTYGELAGSLLPDPFR